MGCQRLGSIVPPGYTNGMKVAVSIPEDVYRRAERLAKLLKRSRSKLYAQALAEYLARHAPDEITEGWNRALAEAGEEADPFMEHAARRRLEQAEWDE